MKTLEDYMSQYAAYHRDRRNIATHLVGIPLIVLALTVLLSRPAVHLIGLWASPALLVALAATTFYLLLDVSLGVVMLVLLSLCLWFGAWVAAQPTGVWLSIGAGGFIVGWVFQFIGHACEGRKPAFVDDLAGLVIGPLFVVAEVLFMMSLRTTLRQHIEARAESLRRQFQAPKH
jgi:uncharacterized membrane protein YGL010W